ncbi:redoxin domain-containing protein [Arthrobacter sp. YAF34]|uniref:redoxin domain-containing protein n=1 Tax=Arthrobacter sp. YAF34 TaxID=3233083 RepID=UPI003F8E8792
MNTTPQTSEAADRRHRRGLAAVWAAAGLAIVVAIAGIFLAALRPDSPSGSAGSAAAQPAMGSAAAELLQLDVLSAPLDTAPDFSLTDQNGKIARLSQYRGKSVVLSFNDDECEDLCTLLAQDVVTANTDLGTAAADVVFLSVNANPLHAAVQDVKAWTDSHGLASAHNWVFGTGTPAQLAGVAASYHVPVSVDPKTGEVVHGSELFFIDPAGKEAAIGQFGTGSANTALFAQAMAQTAADQLPGHAGRPVGGPAPAGNASAGPAALGQPAPAFTLPGLADPGTQHSLARTKGKYTVVNFWASTCSACAGEMPELQKAHTDLGSSVAFLGIDVADPAAPAVALAAKNGTTYPLLADTKGTTAGAYQIPGLPFTAIIAPDGTLAVRHSGTFSAEQLEYVLHTLTNGSK